MDTITHAPLISSHSRHSMATNFETAEKEFQQFWADREWSRYVTGNIIHELIDIKRVNDVHSWIEQSINEWGISEVEKNMIKLKETLHFISEESSEKFDAQWNAKAAEVSNVLKSAISILTKQWTVLAHTICGMADTRNDYVFQNPFGMIAFWRISFERRNKLIFLPGIQVEMAPFLQTLMVQREYVEEIKYIEDVLQLYGPGFPFETPLFDEDFNAEDTDVSETPPVIPKVTADDKKLKKKKSKKSDKNTLGKNIDQLVKQSGKPRRTRRPTILTKTRSPSRSPARRPSVRPSNSPAVARRPSNSPKLKTSKKGDKRQTETQGEHLINLNNESFLGPIYRISVLAEGKKPKQCGSWVMHTEIDLEEEHFDGRYLNISLKVPVEEVFIAPSEPVIAFCDDGSDTWKKGVYTTHSQFDQNTFVLNTRLSKLGRVALFQANDFHYPYRKWSLHFSKESLAYKLHTHSVEIKFVVEGNLIHLETQTGDEFSKLRSLHQKKLSISEIARQLIRHGVFIFPNEEVLKKQKETVKNLALEVQLYRLICVDQLSCHSNRLNGTVPKDTAFVTHNGATLHLSEKAGGGFNLSYHGDLKKENNDSISGRSTLFRLLMLTRPLPLTK